MRFNGLIKTWHDERGFGFITPAGGGQAIFVHVTAFSGSLSERLLQKTEVSFEIETGADGRKRAKHVLFISSVRAGSRSSGKSAAPWGTGSLLALAGFALAYLLVTLAWGTHVLLALGYAVLSLVCALFYWQDKGAAQKKQRRVPEATLLMLGLLGGWPGAIVAQQTLRHKTSKVSFRIAFWATVVLNVGAFLVVTTPLARVLLG